MKGDIMSKLFGVTEVTIEEQRRLINALDEDQYIYLFDSRFRLAVIFDSFYQSFNIAVCSSLGCWYCIDSFYDKSLLRKAVIATETAIVNTWKSRKFDNDLEIIGYKWLD